MSTEEMETAKAIAVEAVKTHLQSVEKRKFALSVGTAVSIVVAICGSTWMLSQKVSQFQAGQDRIESKLTYRVSVVQFKDWALHLERANRNLAPGKDLTVPDLGAAGDAGSKQE